MKAGLMLLFVVAMTTFGPGCGDEEEGETAATPDHTATPGSQTATPRGATEVAPKRAFFTRGLQLWAVEPDGSDSVLLSELIPGQGGGVWPGGTSLPAASPQGNRVAFVSSDGNLWVIDSDGANLRRLSDDAYPEDDKYYSSHVRIAGWSPDSARILYYLDAAASSEEDPSAKKKQREERGFFLVETRSTDKVSLPELPNFIAWTGDSKGIIYEEQDDSGSSRDWYTLDITTRAATKITMERLDCANVHPSFAAARLVYACGSSDVTESSIVLADLDNTDRQVLRHGKWAEFQFPIFSPDRDTFVYQHQSDVMEGGKVIFDLVLFDLATGESTELASGCVRAKGWLDDDSLLFLGDEDESCFGTATLFKVDVGTGALTTLAEGVDWN